MDSTPAPNSPTQGSISGWVGFLALPWPLGKLGGKKEKRKSKTDQTYIMADPLYISCMVLKSICKQEKVNKQLKRKETSLKLIALDDLEDYKQTKIKNLISLSQLSPVTSRQEWLGLAMRWCCRTGLVRCLASLSWAWLDLTLPNLG